MQDPELNKAFLKAIKTYFNDHGLKPGKTEEGRKYNKKYLDGLQKELAPESKFYGKQDDDSDSKTKKKPGYVNTVYKVKEKK
jgi:hypothetical protein